MDRNRLMMIGAVLAAVVVIAGGFFLGVSPQLTAAGTAQANTATVNAQNTTLNSNLVTLKSQYSKLDSLKTQLGVLKESVPTTAATAAFISEVNGLAKSTGVTLKSLTIGDALAYVAPTTTTTPTSSASPSASASATPAPTVAATPTAPTLATSPLITATNFSDLPVSVSVQGTYTQGLAFLEGLRTGKRLFVSSTISYNASSTTTTGSGSSSSAPSSSGLDWTIGGLIYALTDSTTATQQQSTATSTAAGAASGSSTTDAAAGK